MAYTALEQQRCENKARFGADLGPWQPQLYCGKNSKDLKSAALRFLHERCEGLLFSSSIEAEEKATGVLQGCSFCPGQIPYNMQMDINRMCLEKALETFIDSGVAEDAYSVYFCFLEMFVGSYGHSKEMIELLSEYELNGSSLLMKHRDHFSHSVYVFALGLAIYECNPKYRDIFRSFYRLEDAPENAVANQFLQYWGLTALFHDIGYPFELPFEQAISYFEVDKQERGTGCLYLAYHSVEGLTALDDTVRSYYRQQLGKDFSSVTELLAWDITQKLGKAYDFSEDYMLDILQSKPTCPDRFGYYMDHAFFSAARLQRELTAQLGAKACNPMYVDVLSAIMLHNSLYKFNIAYYKNKKRRKAPLKAELHPLAWLLMFCDELQCWDRTAYGRNSRTELHPFAASFDLSEGSVKAEYFYDAAETEKIQSFHAQYENWKSAGCPGKAPRLKAYSDMAACEQSFTSDIEHIVDTAIMPLIVQASVKPVDRSVKHNYLSSSNFLHLYDFAVAIHGRSMPAETPTEVLEQHFRTMSLEYQLFTLNRASSFGRYLDAIGCFYTDRPVDYDMISSFTQEQIDVFAPMEHERWLREHTALGWRYGTEYETLPLPGGGTKEERAALRELLRIHKLVMDGAPDSKAIRDHYFSLPVHYQDKDWKPFENMLRLLKKFDGLRIYHL